MLLSHAAVVTGKSSGCTSVGTGRPTTSPGVTPAIVHQAAFANTTIPSLSPSMIPIGACAAILRHMSGVTEPWVSVCTSRGVFLACHNEEYRCRLPRDPWPESLRSHGNRPNLLTSPRRMLLRPVATPRSYRFFRLQPSPNARWLPILPRRQLYREHSNLSSRKSR